MEKRTDSDGSRSKRSIATSPIRTHHQFNSLQPEQSWKTSPFYLMSNSLGLET